MKRYFLTLFISALVGLTMSTDATARKKPATKAKPVATVGHKQVANADLAEARLMGIYQLMAKRRLVTPWPRPSNWSKTTPTFNWRNWFTATCWPRARDPFEW